MNTRYVDSHKLGTEFNQNCVNDNEIKQFIIWTGYLYNGSAICYYYKITDLSIWKAEKAYFGLQFEYLSQDLIDALLWSLGDHCTQ